MMMFIFLLCLLKSLCSFSIISTVLSIELALILMVAAMFEVLVGINGPVGVVPGMLVSVILIVDSVVGLSVIISLLFSKSASDSSINSLCKW
uniref:NADH dehydrogenase subunit 4L n=1 Tax=Geomydoecus aurei TaxID=161607 RepID=A0A8F4M9A9_9NEOP|nr:NADH dehydrogenase subunit 4L [Geomydoecus aurei]